MIRPFTFVCMLLAGASGLYLYQTKHRAQMLDREIGRTLKQTEVARERIGMLRAEWALLNEPERLGELSKNHLGLRTLAPTQFAALNDLANRLPAPVAPGTTYQPPGFTPDEAAPSATPIAAPTNPAPATPPKPAAPTAVELHTPAAPRTTTPRPAPVQVASAPVQVAQAPAERPPSPVTPAAAPAPRRALTAPVMPVSVTSGGGAQSASNAAVAPGTVGEAVMRAMHANAGSYAPAPYAAPSIQRAAPAIQQAAPAYAPAYAAPAYAAAAYAAPAASMLGGTRAALPPPVPYAAR